MAPLLSAPIDIQWELTPWCTNNCVHCYNYWRRGERPSRRLTQSQMAVHRQTIREIIAHKVFHVTLTGGEPLGVLKQLHKDLMLLSAAGVSLSINTNVALLDTELIKLLKVLGIKSILTSLMSSDEKINDFLAQQPGAYKRTINGIRLAVDEGFHVSVNMVVMSQNFHTIYSTGELAYSLGASTFCATKVSKPSNCEDFSAYALSVPQVQSMFKTLIELKRTFGINVASLEHYPACIFPDAETRALFGTRNPWIVETKGN